MEDIPIFTLGKYFIVKILNDKNILFISPRESKQHKGGISSWTAKLLNNGLPDGYSFKVIDSSVSSNRGIFNLTEYNHTSEILRSLKIIILLIFQIFLFRPKILHVNSSISKYGVFRDLLCVFIAKCFCLTTFVHFRGNLPQVWQISSIFSYKVLDLLINTSNKVLAINDSSYSYLKRKVPEEKIYKLESFIEEDAFERAHFHLKKNKVLNVLFTGAFIEQKGANEILALAKSFPEVVFNLAGQIPQEYQNDILKNANIFPKGVISREEIFELLDNNDIFLFPSHSEGFPNAVLEAMARGLPVIASNVGAIPEMIVDGEGGYLSDIKDINSYSESLKRLAKNLELREKMGKFNYLRARKHYSYDFIVKKMLKIYQD